MTPVVFYDDINWNSGTKNIVNAQFNCREDHSVLRTEKCRRTNGDLRDKAVGVCLLSFLPIPVILIMFYRPGTYPVEV